MLTLIAIFATTALFSLAMTLVLASLLRTGIAGIREWFVANICIVMALPLLMLRGAIPDLISIVAANALLGLAGACYYAGCARFLARSPRWPVLACALFALILAIAYWRYVENSVQMRVIAITLYSTAVCTASAILLIFHRPLNRRPYHYWFAATVAIVFGVCQLLRGLYFSSVIVPENILTFDTIWNVAMLIIGAVTLPTMTMAAIMMVHDSMLASVEDAVNHDHMTGALSRKWLEAIARDHLVRSLKSGRPLSLLVIDLDHFKRINDTYGHAGGDEVLKEFVIMTRASLRDGDALGRLGGEEFGVLLPNTTTEVAIRIATRLREQSEQQLIAGSFGECRYSISIGVATARPDESFDHLSARADSALYNAKNSGRNCVVAYEQTEDEIARPVRV